MKLLGDYPRPKHIRRRRSRPVVIDAYASLYVSVSRLSHLVKYSWHIIKAGTTVQLDVLSDVATNHVLIVSRCCCCCFYCWWWYSGCADMSQNTFACRHVWPAPGRQQCLHSADDVVYCADKWRSTRWRSTGANVTWLGHVTRSPRRSSSRRGWLSAGKSQRSAADNYAVRRRRSIADVLNSCSRSSSVTIRWLALFCSLILPSFSTSIHHCVRVSIPAGRPSSV